MVEYILSRRQQHQACSAKKLDNLSVEADIFYHSGGIVLCNSKGLQFNGLKKERKGAVQIVLYTLMLSFLKLVGFLPLLASHKKISMQRLHCHV